MKSEPAWEPAREDVDALVAEIEQYLGVVDSFRDEGCAPLFEDDEPLARLLSGCYPGT
jgi:hypothetical protein